GFDVACFINTKRKRDLTFQTSNLTTTTWALQPIKNFRQSSGYRRHCGACSDEIPPLLFSLFLGGSKHRASKI
ncbi:hypothetical protein QQP08_025238, partial [Theobroma cacao]